MGERLSIYGVIQLTRMLMRCHYLQRVMEARENA